jgi:cell division transport system permease protein
MPNPISQALNLKSAGIFRLLVVTTALLSGVIALGAASAAMLQGLYGNWQLDRQNSLTVYLPPEADTTSVTQLTQSLTTLQGVESATPLAPQVVQGWLTDVPQAENLPLPTVIEITLQPETETAPLNAHIQEAFPMAEIDDHKPLLQQVSGAVRGLQAAMLGLGAIMLALMALLITLTTRTGLQAQSSTLHLLVQLGATDSVLTRSVCTQVLGRTLAGYTLGTAAATGILLAAALMMPTLSSHLSLMVYATLFLSPLLLPLLALLTASLTTRKLLHQLT